MKDIIADTIYRTRDNALIALLLDDSAWKWIENLLDILGFLKEVTLMVSKSSNGFCMSEVIPFYNLCIESLKDSKVKYSRTEYIFEGIKAAL